ncbi:unnamed protein product [Closterium sp. NIES-53]
MLVLDSYHGHLTKEVKARFTALNLVPAVILAGSTPDVQPIDVSVNKSFKASVRQQYQSWFEADGMNILTPAGTKGPTARTLRVPLTELLRGGDVASTLLLLLLLALTAASAAPLRSATPTAAATPASASSAATSTTTTTAATTPASTAATSTPTPATTSTSTPTPSAASTTASTAPPGPTGSLAPFALARAASPGRGRRHSDRLKTNEVGRSGRGDRGQERGRRTPLKGGGAGVTTRGSYSNYALLSC